MEPPKWIIRFINLYCPPQLAESVIGDIWEQYMKDKERFSKFKSGRRLLWNALRFFRPGILLRNSKTQLINSAMLRINLILAFRNMRKYKFYSLINILGLALSIMFGLLVFFYVQNAIQRDSFHKEHESIYRFTKQARNRDTNELLAWSNTTGNQLAQDLRLEIPSIEYITRLISGQGYVKKESETFTEKIMLVDPDFFNIFSFPIIEGAESGQLNNASQAVISPQIAEKYFGVSSPIGKTLEVVIGNDPILVVVSAVADPVQELNSLPFDVIIHIDHLESLITSKGFLTGYDVSFLETYLKLNTEENTEAMEELLTETFARLANITEESDKMEIKLQPISSLYWWSNEFAQDGEATTYNPDYVYILIGLSLLVIVIAMLNFIMLTSSQSLNRIKEFGIRKTMGAYKRQFSFQLFSEVLVLALMAGIAALFATFYFIPVFNNLTNAKLNFHFSIELIVFALGLIVLISIISSAISSGVILRLKTTNALKGTLSVGGNNLTRNLMVVVQFTFCIGLIIGTIVFKNQMNYVGNKSLGFKKNQLLEIELPKNLEKEGAEKAYQLLRTDLKSNPKVLSTAATMTTMSVVRWTAFTFSQEDESRLKLNFNLVSADYLKTMGLELLAGRDFREDDTGKSIIVNESLVNAMGWKNPLGKQIPGKDFTKSHEIIGIIKDFNFNSLHSEVTPLILATDVDYVMEGMSGISSYVWPPQFFTAVVRVAPGNARAVVDEIHEVWKTTIGDLPFEVKFVDEILNEKYKEELRYSKIINYAAGFSLFIAWLGLLALTRLVIQKRFKEMGIRKVLGSSSLNIILLVAKKFVLLICIATLLASPIAWILLKDWLSDFAYKVDLNPLVFLLSGVVVIAVTFISISIQSLKVSNINPSEALRME